MPKYFIDVRDGDRVYRDELGSEVTGFSQARGEAIEALVDLFQRQLDGVTEHLASAVVRDELGQTLFEASLTFKAIEYTLP